MRVDRLINTVDGLIDGPVHIHAPHATSQETFAFKSTDDLNCKLPG